MGETIRISYEELQALQAGLLAVAAELAEITDGAYVTANLFAQSKSAAAQQMSQLLRELAAGASTLMELCHELAKYFETIIVGFKAWDFENSLDAIIHK